MKINKFQNNIILNRENKGNVKTKKRDESLDSSGVKVEISSSAKELIENINNNGAKHSAKVEEIRKAVIDDTYGVDPEKIAEKILESILNQKGSVD